MRKLFIGCGVVVVVILGLIGYATYRIYPAFKELTDQIVTLAERLDQLDALHPFDPKEQQHLDGQRFARTLDLRVQLIDSMQGTRIKLGQLWDKGADDIGTLERLKRTLSSFAEVLPLYAEQLQAAEMGPAEFAWYTRLFWSTLYRVDAHAAGPELDALKGSYEHFKADYDRMAREQKWPPLAEVLGEFPPTVLAEATTVLARNVDRVQQGLAVTELDYYFMTPLNKLEDVQALRQASSGNAAAAPAPPPGEQTPAPSVTVPISPIPELPAPEGVPSDKPDGAKPDQPK